MERHPNLEAMIAGRGSQASLPDSAQPSPLLLVVDCETRRFTIEGPVAKDCVDIWFREANRAFAAGRDVFCVRINDRDPSEIVSLGVQLGYEHWPANTIIKPQYLSAIEASLMALSAARNHVPRSAMRLEQGRKRSDWLSGLRNATRQMSRAS
jgi:hypothetical protein